MRFQLCAGASVIGFVLSFSPSGFPQDAIQLFSRMQEALGGAEKIASIHDFEETVRADAWHDDGSPIGEVPKRTRWVRPNLLRLDQVGPGDTYVLYFNGVSGWEILPDKTVADLAGGELKFAQHYLWGFDLNLWLADRDPRYVITSTAPYVVSISDKDDPSDRNEFTLNAKTFLPLKTGSISMADPSRPVRDETRLEGWQEFGGVRFPQRITKFHDGRKVAAITVEKIMVNRGLRPDDLSARPPDLKPVMSLAGR
ncbi:MAG: hypothetical protein ACLQOO_17130 [Terriglobia bacterium]